MLEYLILIIFLASFAILTWRNLTWGIALICALLPLYLWRFQIGFIPMTALEAMILILFTVWLIGFLSNKNNIAEFLLSKKVWLMTAVAWLIVAIVAVIVAPDKQAALGLWKAYFLEPILFFIVFIDVIKNKKDLHLIFMSLGISTFYIGALAIYQKFTGYLIPNANWFNPETRRVTAFYGYPNALGLYLAPLAVLFIALCKKYYKKAGELAKWNKKILAQALFFFSAFVFSLAGIIFAVSEGAMVGVVAGLLFFGLLMKKSRFWILGLVVIALVILFLFPDIKEVVVTKLTLQDFSGQLRLIMWGETWQMLQHNFFTGVGLAGYQQAVAPYHRAEHIEIYLYSHNLFLNFWSELGLAGLVFFIWIVGLFFWQGIKGLLNQKNKLIIAGLLSAMVAMLVHGLVDVPYFKNDLSILFWLIIAGLIVVKKIDKV